MEKKDIIELLEKSIKEIESIRSDVNRASLYAGRAAGSYCDYASRDLYSLKEELSQALEQLKQDPTQTQEDTDERSL